MQASGGTHSAAACENAFFHRFGLVDQEVVYEIEDRGKDTVENSLIEQNNQDHKAVGSDPIHQRSSAVMRGAP